MKPLVAIVGSPNVGKSTLFNKLVGKRIAIVEDTPGVTRDRLYADASWLSYNFTVIDTGGIEPDSQDIMMSQMRLQAELAMDTADVILWVTDGRQGVTGTDEEVAALLRRAKKPVVLAVNKLDHKELFHNAYEFYSLGVGEVVPISAGQALGLGDLLDAVVAHFDKVEAAEEQDAVKIAVVGKPNVGKSSLVNAILGQARSIVTPIAGTTRDSIDTPFEKNGNSYVIIDTAGLRRKRGIEDASIERYSAIRSLGAVRRCDVCLVVVDATEGLSEQDVRIAGYCHEEGKGIAVIVNKWDAIEKDTHTMDAFKKDVLRDLAFMSYAPQLYISALTGQRVDKVLELVDQIYEQACRRVTTGVLNDILNEAVMAKEPPSDKGRRLKIYYATQVSIQPPTFVMFVNDPQIMHFSYKRYLENYIRKSFVLTGTPLRIIVRKREKEGN